MVIQCPECGTKYKVPDDKAKPEGTPVRCSKCRHVFKIYPESLEQQAVEEPVVAAEVHREAEDPAVSPGASRTEEDSFEDEQAGEDPGNREETFSAEAPGSGGRKSIRIVLLLLLLLLGGTAAGLYLYPDLPRQIMDMATGTQSSPVPTQSAPETNASDRIGLEGVKQYFVKNEKVGQLFVLEGKAVNRSGAPVQKIVVEATLFDGAGAKVVSDRSTCGTAVSLFQLQVLDRDGLAGALQVEPVTVAPGSEVPFMVVFPDPPQQVQEFGVEVVDVQ